MKSRPRVATWASAGFLVAFALSSSEQAWAFGRGQQTGAAGAGLSGQASDGGRIEAAPKELDDVGVDEHLGRQLPINLPLVEADGTHLALHEVLQGKRPAILTLNYSDCPMLCNLQLDGLAAALKDVGLVAGRDFDVVTVSINPDEKRERTENFRDRNLKTMGRPNDRSAWRFFTAPQETIDTLSRTVGFKYNWVPSQKEYAHTAAFMVLAPDTTITRYIYGVMFEPRDLRLALIEASEGKIGSAFDRVLLYCFHYDAATGRYAPLAQNIMRLGGLLTALALGGTLALFFQRERRRRRRVAARAD